MGPGLERYLLARIGDMHDDETGGLIDEAIG